MQISTIKSLLGITSDHTSHLEKLLSGLGGIIGILAVWFVSSFFLSGESIPLIIASMGASAVLLFAIPHGALSQPWNLLIGHTVSATIGVAVATVIPNIIFAAGLAVGLAILAMHYSRSMHPPGGATALMAVIGGSEIHQLGFTYVLTPVALNAAVILLIAIIFNYPFKWRRYPEGLISKRKCGQAEIQNEDLQYALQNIDAVPTITEHELAELFRLAEKHAVEDHLQIADIHLGHYYSNGKLGSNWAVRHIIDGPEHTTDGDDKLVYKVVAGHLQYSIGSITRAEMAAWSRYEVQADLDRHHGWKRLD